MNIINILYSKEYCFSVHSDYACKITHISFVIHLFVRSNNFNNNNIKSQILRFRVLRSGDPMWLLYAKTPVSFCDDRLPCLRFCIHQS